LVSGTVVKAAIIGLVDSKTTPDALFEWFMKKLRQAYNEGQKDMQAHCIEECHIVRNSAIKCVDPCTEDWIAQRIGMIGIKEPCRD
jgi:hypothetical protein